MINGFSTAVLPCMIAMQIHISILQAFLYLNQTEHMDAFLYFAESVHFYTYLSSTAYIHCSFR